METTRKSYPSDVSDAEWEFLASFLTLMREDAPQREYSLRSLFNAMRYVAKTGCHWRYLPNDLPPWTAVYQQARRWLAWGCFEALLDDLRAVLREVLGRSADPSAVIIDARTLRSSPESGERAGYDGGKRKKGSKLHIAVDTLGNLLALRVTAANVNERAEVGALTREVQAVTDNNVDVAFVDQGYDGPNAAEAAAANDIELVVVKLPEAKKGFVLLPRRWVVERTFAWAVRFRRLVRDYERYASTLEGFHLVAFVCLMLKKDALLAAGS